MIFFKFTIGFFAIFIAPTILLNYKYNKLSKSLILSYGIICSMSVGWLVFLVSFYFETSDIYLLYLSIIFNIFVLSYIYLNRYKTFVDIKISSFYYVTFVVLALVILREYGDIFTSWDAVVSWNRWAVELSNNTFYPMDTAYPVLLPSIWSLLYKIQGTSDIWLTTKLSTTIIPIIMLLIIILIIQETKKSSINFILILSIPFLLNKNMISGYMDMPVMIFGLVSVLLLYVSELAKDKKQYEHYIYTAILFAGIASVIKQAGLVFVLFNMIYIFVFAWKSITSKKFMLFVLLLSFVYFLSFLVLFMQYQNNPVGNLTYLQSLTHSKYEQNNIFQTISYLYHQFSRRPNIYAFITPFLLYFSIFSFSKQNRKLHPVGYLSFIFFVIGFVVWAVLFSYDSRNAQWVKSFFIISSAIGMASIQHKFYFKKIINFLKYNFFSKLYIKIVLKIRNFGKAFKYIFVSIVLILLVYNDDKILYDRQLKEQSEIGGKTLALKLHNLIKNKDKCVKIYSNIQLYEYNSLIKDRWEGVSFYESHSPANMIKNDCVDGSYWALGNYIKKYAGWTEILKLEKNKQIIRIDKKYLLYFVPHKKDN